ncbi:unnamed protein product [Meloidogyne enterolobii]|uniref:Uncharacterized protein n=3 Tax=Meloidogyne enterolobii TaxID=390850 RepID=A0ACB1B659_MELEN|nr:unnamed protein product [Meloidogyne enterolobii]
MQKHLKDLESNKFINFLEKIEMCNMGSVKSIYEMFEKNEVLQACSEEICNAFSQYSKGFYHIDVEDFFGINLSNDESEFEDRYFHEVDKKPIEKKLEDFFKEFEKESLLERFAGVFGNGKKLFNKMVENPNTKKEKID